MTTKEERLKALNNMLEESFDITKVYDDNRNAVLSEIISEIENDEMERLRARCYALSSQMLSINNNLKITETQRNEWLKLVLEDIQKSCNDFDIPMVSLGAGIAMGVLIKHFDEICVEKKE